MTKKVLQIKLVPAHHGVHSIRTPLGSKLVSITPTSTLQLGIQLVFNVDIEETSQEAHKIVVYKTGLLATNIDVDNKTLVGTTSIDGSVFVVYHET